MKSFQLVFYSLIYVWQLFEGTKCYEYANSLIWISLFIYENLLYPKKKSVFLQKCYKILFLL